MRSRISAARSNSSLSIARFELVVETLDWRWGVTTARSCAGSLPTCRVEPWIRRSSGLSFEPKAS
jgi:hypothetical protein